MRRKVFVFSMALAVAMLVMSAYILGTRVNVFSANPFLTIHIESGYCAHLTVVLEKADGTVILIKNGTAIHNAGVLTNIGKDFVEGKLGNPAFGNNTKFPVFISLSTNTGTPSATWVNLPGEITTGGLARAQGTYESIGVGQWRVTYQFTATASHTGVRLSGLHWDSGSGGANLFCSDVFSPVNLEDGDKLTITWTILVS